MPTRVSEWWEVFFFKTFFFLITREKATSVKNYQDLAVCLRLFYYLYGHLGSSSYFEFNAVMMHVFAGNPPP